jgi:hypothetical protein
MERSDCARAAGSMELSAERDADNGERRRVGFAREGGLLTQDIFGCPLAASPSSASASNVDLNESQSGALTRRGSGGSGAPQGENVLAGDCDEEGQHPSRSGRASRARMGAWFACGGAGGRGPVRGAGQGKGVCVMGS